MAMTQYITMYEDEVLRQDIPRIVSIQTNLTNVCPQHCVMCHKPEWAQIQKGRDGQLEPIHTAHELNSLPDLETVVLSGGDPMNYAHLVEYLDEIKPGIKFGMFTTGLDNAKNRYGDLDISRFGYIRFSIDGNTPETWASIRGSVPRAYDTAWSNVLSTLRRFKIKFGDEAGKEHTRVQYTIQSENIHEFTEMVFKCYKADMPIYGYWVHDYNVVTPEQVMGLRVGLQKLKERHSESLSRWLRKWTNIDDIIETGDSVAVSLDARNCVIPLVHAFIDTDGSVFPCCYLVADNMPFAERDLKFAYGNIYKTPLVEILSSENINKIRRAHVNDQNSICSACSKNKSRYYKVNLEAEQLRHRRATFL